MASAAMPSAAPTAPPPIRPLTRPLLLPPSSVVWPLPSDVVFLPSFLVDDGEGAVAHPGAAQLGDGALGFRMIVENGGNEVLVHG
jgi:hypothetical protein